VSDRKIGVDSNSDGTVDYYTANVVTANDYYPFGQGINDRQFALNNSQFRYGFNNKEKDNDINGTGVNYDYGARIYDSRIGKFLSVDPISGKYPWYTPYQFAGNTPIQAIDLDGLEEYHYLLTIDKQGRSHLQQNAPTKYYNTHNFLGFSWQTKINTERYVVTYNNENYYIGFAGSYGRGNENSVPAFKQFEKAPDAKVFPLVFNSEKQSYWQEGINASNTLVITAFMAGEFTATSNLEETTVNEGQEIQEAADNAKSISGDGKGPQFGTKVHKAFENEINQLKEKGVNVSSEVSYLDGKVVPYGTKGSVRADAVVGDINAPTEVYDLKTGGAKLSKAEIAKYQANLPASVKNIIEVKPNKAQ
jgi:RHS repeat-associated protein